MSKPTASPPRLAVALDLDDAEAAKRLATSVAPFFDVAKVGLQLFSAVGPGIVSWLVDAGFSVFVDLKLHDIPTTVERAARNLGRLGATYATVHAAGGVAMLKAGIAGFSEGATERGHPAPTILGVTVLTSDRNAPTPLLLERLHTLQAAGAHGLVCAAGDLEAIRAEAPGFFCVVPGIRPEGAELDDQARVATPKEAAEMGADVLVIGRAVTRSTDPRAAAEDIARSLGRLAR